jgi:ATP-dependent exoDNAse (exonuclease V) beta subunit
VERGVIDLVFRTRHGWQLVDYKTQVLSTDQAGSPATRSVAAMLDQYRAQLAVYTQHWQQVAQEQRVTAGLWLTAHNLWLPLDLD